LHVGGPRAGRRGPLRVRPRSTEVSRPIVNRRECSWAGERASRCAAPSCLPRLRASSVGGCSENTNWLGGPFDRPPNAPANTGPMPGHGRLEGSFLFPGKRPDRGRGGLRAATAGLGRRSPFQLPNTSVFPDRPGVSAVRRWPLGRPLLDRGPPWSNGSPAGPFWRQDATLRFQLQLGPQGPPTRSCVSRRSPGPIDSDSRVQGLGNGLGDPQAGRGPADGRRVVAEGLPVCSVAADGFLGRGVKTGSANTLRAPFGPASPLGGRSRRSGTVCLRTSHGPTAHVLASGEVPGEAGPASRSSCQRSAPSRLWTDPIGGARLTGARRAPAPGLNPRCGEKALFLLWRRPGGLPPSRCAPTKAFGGAAPGARRWRGPSKGQVRRPRWEGRIRRCRRTVSRSP